MKFSIFKYFILLFLIGKEPVKKWIAPEIDYLTYIEEKPKIRKPERLKDILKGTDVANGNLNFIFYKNKVYLFIKPISLGFMCGNGIDYSKPFKQNITTDSLIEITSTNFHKIISNKIKILNLPLEEARKEFDSYDFKLNRINISIAIDKDSVKGKIPILIRKICRDKRIRFSFVRKLTEEEQEVVEAKYYNLPYDFDKVNWKVGFADYKNFIDTIPLSV